MQKPLASGGKHGIAPEERDIKEHLRKGIIVIDKPRGPTSHQVSAWVRNLVGAEKAGHGGTLDPNVSGVLVIALDDALKALQVLLLDTKEYITTLKLHGQVDRKELESVIKEFTSEIYQTPPVRAAVKRERRARTVHEMEILDVVDRSVLFRAVCESGTYIRTLCVDMGDVLGVGGHMFELRRSRTAGFDESQLVTLHELKDAFVAYEEGDEKPLRKIVLPFERLLDHLPKVYVKDSAVDAICHGADVAIPGITRIDGVFEIGQMVAVMSQKGEGVAVGKAKMESAKILETEKGSALNLERVFMAPGTYPQLWKKSRNLSV
ncbi:MAG: RNA-guided pseudouridylation complex pseudouridine synthase subunit Cbf5 [Candidatus Thermoplasmatota archaeon]|nr:RNA-guided pseudouridylation complex pseudouridine synthase subunit Cbf5 [Euryarchaeota archaeon]MBU4144076.1 RNA-guided pseudouridylation complex pseudouridine synthase subunit Cbf5 [Candidatus Thermoplasmatota archaeon]MBU4592246.1 RNA-guided pseudouridylation complex pseudouridine synthase subunit Cbf5 [Candidatus Thermoplasmatota archaeon]